MKKNYHIGTGYIMYPVIFLLFIAMPVVRAQSLRVEPMNWWVGMKNQQLQLLVYGEGLHAGIVIPWCKTGESA